MLTLEPLEGSSEVSNEPLSALTPEDFLSAEQLLASHEVPYSIQFTKLNIHTFNIPRALFLSNSLLEEASTGWKEKKLVCC